MIIINLIDATFLLFLAANKSARTASQVAWLLLEAIGLRLFHADVGCARGRLRVESRSLPASKHHGFVSEKSVEAGNIGVLSDGRSVRRDVFEFRAGI